MTFDPKRDISIAKSDFIDKITRIQRAVFFEVSRRIVIRTPVDTGRAIGNWLPSVNSFRTETIERLDPSGGQVLAEVAAVVAGHVPGQDLTLANNVNYIRYLEEGSSQKSPAGMVAVTAAEFEGLVEVQAARVR